MSTAVEYLQGEDTIWSRRAAFLRDLAVRYALPDVSLRSLQERERELREAGAECTGLTLWLDNLPGYRTGQGQHASEMHGFCELLIIRGDERRRPSQEMPVAGGDVEEEERDVV